jgi:apolipoprotein N-acyltransferase
MGALAAGLPALWELGEWLRSWVMTGFPWGAVGYSQVTESPLAGFIPLGGVHLASWLVALSAGALALLANGQRLQRLAALIGLLVLWSSGFWLQTVSWTEPVGKPYRVALAQGDIPQAIKWDPATFEHTDHLLPAGCQHPRRSDDPAGNRLAGISG